MRTLTILEKSLNTFQIKNLYNEIRKMLFLYYEMCLENLDDDSSLYKLTYLKNVALKEYFLNIEYLKMKIPPEFNCPFCSAGLRIVRDITVFSIKCPDCDNTGIKMKPCSACDENGLDEDGKVCKICKGTHKYFFRAHHFRKDDIPCPTCLGTKYKIIEMKGKSDFRICKECSGMGFHLNRLQIKPILKNKDNVIDLFDVLADMVCKTA